MITVSCHLLPLLCHLFRFAQISGSNILLTEHFGHLTVSSDSHNSFYRQVGIVSEMPRKIIGTELVFRIHSMLE